MVLRLFSAWCCAMGLFWSPMQAAAQAPSPPTSRPLHRTSPPLPSSPGYVFIGLPHLQKLLGTQKRRDLQGLIPLQAKYTGTLQKGWLQLHVDIILAVPAPTKAQTFALGGRGGVLFQVQVQGQNATPTRDANGSYSIPIEPSQVKEGRVALRYEYGLRVPSARGEHKLSLDLPRCGQALLQLQFPGAGWEARTQPASRVTLQENKQGTKASLALPDVAQVQLIWKGKRIERKEQTRFRTQLETLVTLQEGLLQGESRLQMELLTGSLRSVRFSLPSKVELLHVGGNGVVEWYQSAHANAMRTYTVQLSRAERKALQIRVRFEQTNIAKEQQVSLPALQVLGSEQTSGTIGVLAKADTEVSHHHAENALQVDVRSLPGHIRQRSNLPILLAYQFDHNAPSIQVRMVRHPQLKVLSTVINRAHFETVRTRMGHEIVKATYWVTNKRLQFMPIELPRNAEMIGAFVAGQPVQPARAPEKRTRRSINPPKSHYLLPLVRSGHNNSSKEFTVELLFSQKARELRTFGVFRSSLPSTSLQILSYQWDYYLPNSHLYVWLEGTAYTDWQQRFTRRLFRRLQHDLRAGTPVLWAGDYNYQSKKRYRSRLNVYNALGLKERFAQPSPIQAADVSAPSRSAYRSRFAKTQWQVRAQMPLVGQRMTFYGHLLRNRAPFMNIWYVNQHSSQLWFWLVFLLTACFGVVFLHALFAPGKTRWGHATLAILVWGGLFVAGYFLPLTYLAGFRGLITGFWLAVLLGLAVISEEQRRVPSGYLIFARWGAVFLTFFMLLGGNLGLQIACLFAALPIYPALLRKRPEKAGGEA